MLRNIRLAAIGVASLLACALPAAAQTLSGVPTLGSDSTTYTWGAQTIATGKLGGAIVKYTYNGTSWVVEPADTSGRSFVSLVAPSGAFSSGAFSSGAFASGALSAGSVANGALVAGSGVDGWDVTEGSTGQSAYAGSGSASIIQILKGIYASAVGSIPVGSNNIGTVGLVAGSSNIGNVGLTGQAPGASTITPAQVSVASTATQIVASRTGRAYEIVTNTGTTDIYLGGSGVTTSTGTLLVGIKGASVAIPFQGALYGIVASGTANVTSAEVY